MLLVILPLGRDRRHGSAVAVVEGRGLAALLVASRRGRAVLALGWRSLVTSVLTLRGRRVVLALRRGRLVATVLTTGGRGRGVLVLRSRVLGHLPLSAASSLLDVEEALALLIKLLDPARGKLATSLGRRRSCRGGGLSVRARVGLAVRTGLAVGLLVLRRVGLVLLRRI